MILIKKGKGGKNRYVPLLPELAQELKTHLGSRFGAATFLKATATRNSRRAGFSRSLKKPPNEPASTKKVHPHLLRHTVATFLLEKGMPPEQIQKFLGHSKIETTQIYAGSLPLFWE